MLGEQEETSPPLVQAGPDEAPVLKLPVLGNQGSAWGQTPSGPSNPDGSLGPSIPLQTSGRRIEAEEEAMALTATPDSASEWGNSGRRDTQGT